MGRIRVYIPILRTDFQRARQPLSLGVAATAREEADWIEDGLERQHRHEFLLIRSLITIGFISSVFFTMKTVVFITFLESN